MTQLTTTDAARLREALPLRRRALVTVEVWLGRHAPGLTVLALVLVAVAVVRATGMATGQRYVDDPGTYLSQAWSVQYEGKLSPYSYFYDHAPAGWLQIALWSMLTNGFVRHDSAMGLGNEVMLLAGLASTALLFLVGRRLGLGRGWAGGAALLFGLSPLAVTYGRWTFLDNLVTPWLLAAMALALSPRRSLGAGAGAALCLAMAALTKETALVFAPGVLWAMWQNSDRRNRRELFTVAGGLAILVMGLYPTYALLKGELFPGPGHNSLLGTAAWQLAGRESSGWLWDAGSEVRHLLAGWLQLDPVLLVGGLVALPVAILDRQWRPVALILVTGWLLMARGGYVPYMHVLGLLPWSALLVVGALSGLTRRVRRRSLRVAATGVAVLALAAVPAARWPDQLRPLMTTTQLQPLRAAELWTAANVPRDKVLVVHDSLWVDLVFKYGFRPRPIIVNKLDADPAVAGPLKRIDYLILPNWYYGSPQGAKAYPTVLEARKHAVAVARFGTGDDGVSVYRVSRFWRP